MKRLLLAVFCLLFVTSLQGQAQYVPPSQRPPVSPYINFLRPGNPVLNYEGLVRPQLEMNRQIQGLQQQTAANQTAIAEAAERDPNALPTTGHTFGYSTHWGYFMNNMRGGAGGAGRVGGMSPGLGARPGPLLGGGGGAGIPGAMPPVTGGTGGRGSFNPRR